MILVTGAGGKTGKAVVRKLSGHGANVRAWIHGVHQEGEIKQLGAEDVIIGDLRDSDIMKCSCKDIEAVYHICPNMSPDEVEIGKSLLLAARNSGVSHFVYHSVLHAQVQAMPHHWKKMLVEEQIFSSGINFTILQPTAYYQNLLAYWPRIISEGIFEVPYAVDTRLGMVDLEDVAAAAAVVTNNPDFFGGTFELVATPAYTQTEIAQIIESQIGQPVEPVKVSRKVWETRARQSSMSEYAVQTLLKMFEYYEEYGMWGNPHVLESILRRKPHSLTDFIDRLIHSQSHRNEAGNG